MNGQGKYEWQRRQRYEIVGGMPSTGDTGRPRMNQRALRRHLANEGNQPRSGVTATVAIPGWEELKTMTNEETIIDLLTEIRDLLRGGAGATAVHQAGPTQSFTAESLSATVDKGKTYWKVQGGMFTKFGVTVWPETLAAAGFDPENMNPTKVYDIPGYTAVYVLNEEGKAQKVIQLIPPTAVPAPEPAPPAPQAAKRNGRANGKPAPAPAPTEEPSWFRPGDKVQATDQNGKQHTGVITGTVGSDNKIAVKIGEKIHRVDVQQVEMLEPAF